MVTSINAQITVETNNAVVPLVQRAFNVEGVEISNITFKGKPEQFGFFTETGAQLDLATGLVLTSGRAKGIEEGDVNSIMGTNDLDPDLFKIGEYMMSQEAGFVTDPNERQKFQGIYDAAIVEFDIVSSNVEVVFSYIFASQEFATGPFESTADIMGVFLSGPGINGEYENGAELLSLIPNTDVPVGVTSVKSDEYSGSYYVDNLNRATAGPLNENNPFTGFTQKFEIRMNVEPCETYHLKFAVSDGYEDPGQGGDRFDGAMFINATSYEKNKYAFETFEANTARPSTALIEGCRGVDLRITRLNGKNNVNDTVFLSVAGNSDAKIGDMQSFPGQVIIPAGQTSVVVSLGAAADGAGEGTEDLLVNLDYRDACFSYVTQRTFVIEDAEVISAQRLTPVNQSVGCPGESVTMEVSATGGYGGLSYQWYENAIPIGGANDPALSVSPMQQTEYGVIVTDDCDNSQTITFSVTTTEIQPIAITMEDTLGSACFGSTFSVSPTAISGGFGQFDFQWTYEGGEGSTEPVLTFVPTEAGFVYLSVTDACNNSLDDSVYVAPGVQRDIRLEVSADTNVCEGQPVILEALATGGTGDLYYSWPQLERTGSQVEFVPQNSARIQVVVTDDCGVENNEEIVVDVNEVLADYEYFYEENDALFLDSYSTGKEIVLEWSVNDTVISEAPQVTFPAPNYNDNLEVKLKVTDVLGCTDSLEHIISPPLIVFMPNAFTPDGDGFNDTYKVVAEDLESFRLTIYDRWGRVVFETNDVNEEWDGYLPESRERALGIYIVHVVAVRNSKSRFDGYGSLAVMY